MADKGTLFLDEVGDIPLALQPKLLRVLQEQEFERLGGTRTHQVDVRLVAATNRNLAEMVKRNEFRSDLYYRLNVFPIPLPPLRERREDIPALVAHFVELYGRRMGKQIEHIPPETMSALSSYVWPGNIRELQNFIERSVIVTSGNVLHPPLTSLKSAAAVDSIGAITLEDAERDHILKTLEQTRWVVSGPNGAACPIGNQKIYPLLSDAKAWHLTYQQESPFLVANSLSAGNWSSNRLAPSLQQPQRTRDHISSRPESGAV